MIAHIPDKYRHVLLWTMIPLLVGLMIIFVIWPLLRTCHQKRHILETTGTVVSLIPHPGKYANMPAYDVIYRYTVNDHEYEANRVSLLPGSMTATELSKLDDRFPIGSAVVVYYLEQDPATAALDVQIPAAYYLAAFVALALTAGYILVVIPQWKQVARVGRVG